MIPTMHNSYFLQAANPRACAPVAAVFGSLLTVCSLLPCAGACFVGGAQLGGMAWNMEQADFAQQNGLCPPPISPCVRRLATLLPSVVSSCRG
jgi:hypothetical protein